MPLLQCAPHLPPDLTAEALVERIVPLLWTEQEQTVVVSWSRRFNNFYVSPSRLVRVERGLGRAGGPMISSYFSTSTHYMP